MLSEIKEIRLARMSSRLDESTEGLSLVAKSDGRTVVVDLASGVELEVGEVIEYRNSR